MIPTTNMSSAASPVFAAMISLINNARFEAECAPMGFLNPFLWSIGDVAFTEYVV